jgi:hypothetical protein
MYRPIKLLPIISFVTNQTHVNHVSYIVLLLISWREPICPAHDDIFMIIIAEMSRAMCLLSNIGAAKLRKKERIETDQ